ncbi:hypothetical protein BD311DRAFT_447814 [Dichomitus squalens]|uniref:C2H2-type domain-containing protein n=1 Tax=Dichomitus squalens TaxID=114155 RepID=A0A4Q9MHP9_9APHY|nr:hypothetical protein BD311DRAFT_447814 [Dichomitus squalens]
MSSSVESDRGPIVNALAMLERQDELCRDYTCCGLNLTDLHALVEHFEECHVVVLDPYAPQQLPPQTSAALPNSAGQQAVASYFPDGAGVPSTSSQQHPQRIQTQQQQQQQAIAYQGFDPDDMELDVDQNASAPSSGAPSPPDTPISTPLSGYPSPTAYSAASSPHQSQPASPISAFETATVLPSRSAHSAALGGFRSSMGGAPAGSAARAEDAFNAYAGYSDYSSLLPGAAPLGSGPNAMFMQQGMTLGAMNGGGSASQNGQTVCAPTALLLSGSAGNTPDSTPASSRVASPIPGGSGAGYRNGAPNAHASSSSSGAGASASSSGANANAGASTARASTTLSRPASSLLLSKPFKCPKPNCNKSYKQANGLKYHMTHGSCNFAPPKDLEHLQELLASKRSEKARAQGGQGATGAEGEVTLSDAELREVEKEAERRLRPYACGVGECQRRYKNMNGLRYHYQHSGDHGAIGLALLASGQHECLQHNRSRHATPSHSASNSVSGTPSQPRTPAPQQSFAGQQQQQAQQAAFAQPPTYQSAMASPPAYAYQPQQYAQYAQAQQYVVGMQQQQQQQQQ